MGKNVWERRDAALSALGYPDYRAYLSSHRWLLIRGQVLARDGYRCGCGARADQVHHRRYDVEDLSGETLDLLISVCAPCHDYASVSPAGKVLTPEETDRILFRRWYGIPKLIPVKPIKKRKKRNGRNRRQQRAFEKKRKRKKWEAILRSHGLAKI